MLKRDHSIKDIHVEPIIKKTMNINKTEVREIIKSEAKCAPPPHHIPNMVIVTNDNPCVNG